MKATIRWTLIVMLCVLACGALMAFPGNAQAPEIFDVSRSVLPLIGGIVLGFHIGSYGRWPRRVHPPLRRWGCSPNATLIQSRSMLQE